MVGELRDKILQFGAESGPLAAAGAGGGAPSMAPTAHRISVNLTKEQFDTLMGQWVESARNLPTEVVFTVDSRPVGIMQVIASLFVEPS